MKHIDKDIEPEIFASWKRRKLPKGEKQSYKNMPQNVKNDLLFHLIQEQGGICCYCENELFSDCHIEHFRPKSTYPKLQIEYSNLLCSCLKDLPPRYNSHCGPLKDNWYNELLISPLDDDCEDRFIFTANGYIEPKNADDISAITTIDKLGLNVDKLIALRREVYDSCFFEGISVEDAKFFAEDYLNSSETGFNKFHTTVKYFLEKECL